LDKVFKSKIEYVGLRYQNIKFNQTSLKNFGINFYYLSYEDLRSIKTTGGPNINNIKSSSE